jgi:hypothetical protein
MGSVERVETIIIETFDCADGLSRVCKIEESL